MKLNDQYRLENFCKHLNELHLEVGNLEAERTRRSETITKRQQKLKDTEATMQNQIETIKKAEENVGVIQELFNHQKKKLQERRDCLRKIQAQKSFLQIGIYKLTNIERNLKQEVEQSTDSNTFT